MSLRIGLSALVFLFALRLRSMTNKKSSNNAFISHAIYFSKFNFYSSMPPLSLEGCKRKSFGLSLAKD
jgi:hypothetical protein